MSNSGCFSVFIRGCELDMRKENRGLSIKTIPFDGKKDNVLIWIKNLKSKVQEKGSLDILTNVEWITKMKEYEDVKNKTGSDRTVDKESIIVRCDRGMAKYSDLVLSINTAKNPGETFRTRMNKVVIDGKSTKSDTDLVLYSSRRARSIREPR